MDQLGAMKVFVQVVESRGFTAAARELGMTLPTVCRKVAELENKLNSQLFIRSTRKVTTTDCGERYYEDVKRILEDIDVAERYVIGEFTKPKGLLTITASSRFGRIIVLPIVLRFMQLHEDIQVRLLFTNNLVDLSDHHVDLGFRIGEIFDTSLNTIWLGAVRWVVCASSEYFEIHGKPQSPSDLKKHQCVSLSVSGRNPPWEFLSQNGNLITTAVKPNISVSTTDGAVDALLQDAGICQLLSYQVGRHVINGDLALVLEEFETSPIPINIIYPTRVRMPQKVQSFVDYARSEFQASVSPENMIEVDGGNLE